MKHKKLKIALITVFAVLAALAAAFFIYVGNYYKADQELLNKLDFNGYEMVEKENNTLAFVPQVEYSTGINFIRVAWWKKMRIYLL